MPNSIKEQSFNTNAITLNYAEVDTSGPPLLLIHGGASGRQNFETIMPELAIDWHLFAPDLRGHGQSERANGRYRLQDYADDVIVFLREVVGKPAAIVGHSLGGMVALMVAAQCPELVRAVVVGDSPLTAKTWWTVLDTHREDLIRYRAVAGGQVSLEEVAAVVTGVPAIFVYQTDPEMYTAILDDFDATASGYEMESLLPAVRCPVLLLQADPTAGGIMTDAEVVQAMTLLPHATHVYFPGLSHVLHNEQKRPVMDAITLFLESI